jgi:hypothetical protein
MRIKEGIFEGILEDRKSNYRWPRPQPWQQAYGRVMEKLTNYVCIHTSILTKKLGAFVVTEKSQEFLFQWESSCDRLIDFRASETVEDIQINERHGRRAHFKLESKRGNTNYNELSCAYITITDTHVLMHGRANAIVQVPPPQMRRRIGQEANDPKKTDYTRIWRITQWPTERRINKL